MGERERLEAAIAKNIEYAENKGAVNYLRKVIAYQARLAALDAGEAADIDTELSSDASVAVHQILAAIGHPTAFDETGASIADDPSDILGDASAEQIRELALLGKFGAPGTYEGVDYSLYEQFYVQKGSSWQPKNQEDDYIGAWAEYLASQDE